MKTSLGFIRSSTLAIGVLCMSIILISGCAIFGQTPDDNLFLSHTPAFDQRSAPRIGIPEAPNCPENTAQELVLTEVAALPFAPVLPPRALRLGANGTFITISSLTGALVRLDENGGSIAVDSSTKYTAIGIGDERILATDGRKVYSWSHDSIGSKKTLPLNLSGNPTILSLFASNGQLWLSTVDSSRASIYRVSLDSRKQFSAISLEWPAILRKTASGGALVASISYPYTIAAYDSSGQKAFVTTILDEYLNWSEHEAEALSVFTIAAVSLDCGRILQMLGDLRSNQRWIVVYDQDGQFIRIKHLNYPFGIVQSLYPKKRLLLGFRDLAERRGITLFTWAWRQPLNSKGETQ